jgi:hypothetical protein
MASIRKHTNRSVDDRTSDIPITRLGEYVNIDHPIDFRCDTCSFVWAASPYCIMNRKSGCPKCAGMNRVTNEECDSICAPKNITRLDDVVTNSIPIRWQCEVCTHIWKTRPSKITTVGTGCPKCANKIRLTNDEVDERVKPLDIIRLDNYVNTSTKIRWKCKACDGVWRAKPSNIFNQHTGCPHCRTPAYSKVSIKWLEETARREGVDIMHAANGSEYKIPGTRLKCDGYCNETNTVYEFYGDIWHGNPEVFADDDYCSPYHKETAGELYQRTMEREKKIREMGYNVVTIWENDYKS